MTLKKYHLVAGEKASVQSCKVGTLDQYLSLSDASFFIKKIPNGGFSIGKVDDVCRFGVEQRI